MKLQTFEDFLNEYYLEHEDEGRSHNSSSAQENYECWLENLQIDDLIGLADRALERERARFEAFRKDILQDLKKMGDILAGTASV
jgi:hypothetical protein